MNCMPYDGINKAFKMGKNKESSENKKKGAFGFECYYSDLYSGRWPSLKSALLQESRTVSWNVNGKDYFLDTASILAASVLPLKGAERILDMCAAPGGKSLVIAARMDKDAKLQCNERSFDRKQRLVRVLDEHLPVSIRKNVVITCTDGATLCKNKELAFDRILLDAPCSSERHVLCDSKYLDQWSPARIKSLSIEQWSLLSSAYRMLVPGGFLLYSTCALANSENDAVIKRLMKKFSDSECCVPCIPDVSDFTSAALPSYEKTEYGFHVLPDKQNGAGPIYFCLIKKLSGNVDG